MVRTDALTALGLGVASAAVSALAQLSTVYPVMEQPWLGVAFSIAIAAPLAIRRVWPWVAAITTPAIYMFAAELGHLEITVTQVALFLSFYSIGAWDPNRRRAFWVRLAVVVAMATWLAISLVTAFTDPETGERGVTAFFALSAIQVVVNIGYYSGAWVFGNRAWNQALEREELERAYAHIRDQQGQLADQAVSLERVRIARELHDVVAHHVSAMGIQAGAARRVLGKDPVKAESSLRSVEQSARDAIGELRAMVTSLRTDDDTGSIDAPMPTLADLDRLIDTARDSGQRVERRDIGTPSSLSPVAELTAFRVVQEALTNVRKHSGDDTRIDLRLRFGADQIEVEVGDDGRAATRAPGTGLGLIGMQERVTAVGGTFTAGPKSRGGWLVRARIPNNGRGEPAPDSVPASELLTLLESSSTSDASTFDPATPTSVGGDDAAPQPSQARA